MITTDFDKAESTAKSEANRSRHDQALWRDDSGNWQTCELTDALQDELENQDIVYTVFSPEMNLIPNDPRIANRPDNPNWQGVEHWLDTAADPLFIGCYPEGIVYSDRFHEQNGDYTRLAFLSYATLTLDIRPTCPPDLAERIRTDAATIQAKSGQVYPITAAGQGVLLGSANMTLREIEDAWLEHARAQNKATIYYTKERR